MYSYFATAGVFAEAFLRSAQRRFMASAMRFRPSGESLRLVVFFGAAGVDVAVFLLPFGRPGRRTDGSVPAPERSTLACCNLTI